MSDDQLDAWERASDLISRGFSLVPIERGKKKPPFNGWDKYWDRKPTVDEITSWIRQGFLDWGIMCGPVSNIVVVDLDDDAARAWAMERGLGSGPSVATGKGWHHYYRAGEDGGRKKVIGLAGMKVDVLTRGGMVLAPGSRHPNGNYYEWIDSDGELESLPAWVREAMELQQSGKKDAAKRVQAATALASIEHGDMGLVVEGGRNNQMYRVAASCRGKECMDFDDILLRLRAENLRLCNPPLSESELKDIAQSAMQLPKGEHKRYILTDEGNMDRLIDNLNGNMRYVKGGGFWIRWDGRKWVEDDDLMISNLARQSNALISKDLSNPNLSDEERKALVKHYQRSMSYNRIEAVAKMAKACERVWVEATELDKDPMLLNCPNGTLDLRTGELRKHSREDFITKTCGVEYDPTLLDYVRNNPDEIFKSSWYRFLTGMFSHPQDYELQVGAIEYFQRLLGYSLTGMTTEQKWFVWRGVGANGKSTTVKVLARILGDYQLYVDVRTFMKQGRNSEANMARARGARLVLTSEPSFGMKLDETLVKSATGGGGVEARYLYQKPFSYVPTWKIIMEANSRPEIAGGDEGNYRRIHELRFLGDFRKWPQDQSDAYFHGYSRSIDADLQAEDKIIFAWIVAGTLEWRSKGLQAPPSISQASKQYREQMDPIQTFIDECCQVGKGAFTSTRDMHAAFTLWCINSGEFDVDEVPSKNWMTRQLTDKGHERATKDNKRGVGGVRLDHKKVQEIREAVGLDGV